MSEYKWSITAKEIDERLGQIPQLALDIENLKQNGGVVVGGSVDYSEPIYENGFIDINIYQETKVEGLFACGDVTNKPLRQVIIASGDAALATHSILNYLRK